MLATARSGAYSLLLHRLHGLLLVITVAGAGLAHAGLGHALKQALNLGRAVGEAQLPEVVARVLDELDEGDQQAPGMRPVHYEALQEHARDLLLNDLLQSHPPNVKYNLHGNTASAYAQSYEILRVSNLT